MSSNIVDNLLEQYRNIGIKHPTPFFIKPIYHIQSDLLEYHNKRGDEIYTVIEPYFINHRHLMAEKVYIIHSDQFEKFEQCMTQNGIEIILYD